MSDYLTAYGERMVRVTNTILDLATEVAKEGHRVFVPNSKTKTFMVIYGEIEGKNFNLSLEFRETPYRWVFYKKIKPSKENGSSRIIEQIYGEPSIIDLRTHIKLQAGNSDWMNFDKLDKMNQHLVKFGL